MRDATRGSKRTTSSPPASTHIPKRGGTPLVDVLPSQIRFQLTLPMRDATVREVRQDTADTLGLHLNFNSRTRVGYDSTPYVSHVERGAFQLPHPMRGATHNLAVLEKRMFISTPAPAWGATPYTVEQMRYLVFQLSHPVRGATRHKPSHLVLVTFQLPHPVRGATQTIMCFPPHIQKLAIKFFNSRTPRGVRPGSAWIQTGFSHFNSRTRAGCDRKILCLFFLSEYLLRYSYLKFHTTHQKTIF